MAKRGAGAQMAMGSVTRGYHLRVSTGEWAAWGPRGEKRGTAQDVGAARRAAKRALDELCKTEKDGNDG